MRRIAGRNKQDLVHLKLHTGCFCGYKMSVMDRIERTAHDADPAGSSFINRIHIDRLSRGLARVLRFRQLDMRLPGSAVQDEFAADDLNDFRMRP